MRSYLVCLLMLPATLTAGITFNDIDVWIGEGANQAALVVDWNDGPSELVKVWGFRWDGELTGADMLEAVCRADAGFFNMVTDTASGQIIGGLGYDRNGNGIYDISREGSAGMFDADGSMTVASNQDFDGWTPSDTGDVWSGGWWSDGFWGYSYVSPGSVAWESSSVGASMRTLVNGSWEGWSWGAAPSWYGGDPSVVVAVPEPATLLLLCAGLVCARKRK